MTAILFVLGCSDYDLLLEEDMTTNRMEDALKLFNDVVNNKWFSKTNVVVFLNKKDLFAEKIGRVPLKVGFPTYEGKNEYADGMAHILKVWQRLLCSCCFSRVAAAGDQEHQQEPFGPS